MECVGSHFVLSRSQDLFRFVWFITGSVWVYRASPSAPLSSSSSSACVPELLLYTFWIITAHWAVAAVCVLCCVTPVVCCYCVARRRKHPQLGIAPPNRSVVSTEGVVVIDSGHIQPAPLPSASASAPASSAPTIKAVPVSDAPPAAAEEQDTDPLLCILPDAKAAAAITTPVVHYDSKPPELAHTGSDLPPSHA